MSYTVFSSELTHTNPRSLFFNTLYLGRKYASQIRTEPERASTTIYVYLGWLMALAGTWLLTPSEWLVIIWLSLGFLLYSGYRKWGQSHLSRISHFTLISAVTRIAIISYPGDVPAAVEFGRVAAAPVNTLRQQTHRCQEISVCF